MSARLMRWALIAAVLCGPPAVVMSACSGGGNEVTSAPAPATVNTDRESQAADFAEQFVVTWLQSARGDEQLLSRFVSADALALPPQQSYTVSEPRLAGIEEIKFPPNASGYEAPLAKPTYLVSVSASVKSVADRDGATVRRYYQVPVVFVTDSTMRATNAPSPISGPNAASDLELGYQQEVSTDSALGASLAQFLAAMIAGQGDLTRFISPGSTVRPIVPAPYATVSVSNIVADSALAPGAADAPPEGLKVRVLVTASAIGADNASVPVQYPLTVAARAGRWEVVKIDRTALIPSLTDDTSPATHSGRPEPTTQAPLNPSTSTPGQDSSSAETTPTTSGQLLAPTSASR